MSLNSKSPSSLNFEAYTILIIDDNVINLEVVADYLKSFGFKLELAGDGESALQKTSHFQPDLILLDILMPEFDGFEVCRVLKADEALQNIPVIFVTIFADK